MIKQYITGPITNKNRSCTDIFCCGILLIVFLGMFFIAVHAWFSQNFHKLTVPYDPDGRGCGTDYEDYPYIYFASPHADSLWVTVCVKQCPKQNDESLKCKPNSYVNCLPINDADNEKAVQIYDTYPVKAMCMPSNPKIQAEISHALSSTMAVSKIITLKESWPIVALSIPISIVLAVSIIILMRYLSSIFLYLLFGILIGGAIGFGTYLIVQQKSQHLGTIQINKTQSLIIGILCVVIGFIFLLLLICYRKRIALASAITQVSARFVNQNCLIVLLSFALFVCMITFILLWIYQALAFYSLGNPVRQQKQLPFQHFQFTPLVSILGLVHVFQLIWVLFFLGETGSFLVAGAVTSWYFNKQNPFNQSRKRYFRYHIGSVAMGSFLVALFGFIKFVYELFKKQEKQQQTVPKNGISSYCAKTCNCLCCCCIVYLFNWFNNGSYTYIHLTGDNYCQSACQVMSLMIKQPIATSVISFMRSLFSVLVKLGITISACSICYAILKSLSPFNTQIHDIKAPMFFILVIAYNIATFFQCLYSEAMQSIYVCYLADAEGGGISEKAPKQLINLLDEAKDSKHFVSSYVLDNKSHRNSDIVSRTSKSH